MKAKLTPEEFSLLFHKSTTVTMWLTSCVLHHIPIHTDDDTIEPASQPCDRGGILTKTTANLIQRLVSVQKAAEADDMASLSTMLVHAEECALQMDRQAMALLQENGNLRDRLVKCERAAFDSTPISKLPTHGESVVPKPSEWIDRAIRSFMVS